MVGRLTSVWLTSRPCAVNEEARMKRIVIADDLTGANNVGVLLTKQGLSTVVVAHESPTYPGTCDVLCIDTDSRYVTAHEAAQRVQRVVERGLSQGTRLFCNRVDNLLRGNIGAETAGILRALGPEALAVVVPAFPALERHVVNGHLLVQGTPVHRHPIAANDPIAPVRHSFIADIFTPQFSAPMASIGLSAVESGAEPLAQWLEREATNGVRAVVIDASSDEHLHTIAHAMAMLERPCVPVDPGPLSAVYLRSHRERMQPSRGRAVLVSVGSVTPLSRQQVDYLLAESGIDPVRLDARALIEADDTVQSAIQAGIAECQRRAEQSSPVIVLTTHQVNHRSLELESLARQRGLSPHRLAKRISAGLAEVTFEVLCRNHDQIGGCFTSGGDLTASLFQVSKSEAIKILGDVIPLTAYVELIGGRLHGLRMVTKGGSIGDDSSLFQCVEFLRAQLERM